MFDNIWEWMMAKNAKAKAWLLSIAGGRRYSRGPTDIVAPSAPQWIAGSDPVPNLTTISILWLNGGDGQTGIRDALVEIRLNGTSTWSQFIVPYPGNSYVFTGLSAGTSYDIRIANRDLAPTPNISAYTSIKTLSTTGSAADFSPGTVSIAISSATVNEGAPLGIAVTRSGAGVSSPAIDVQWAFAGFSQGTPTPANDVLSWPAGVNSTQSASSVAGSVTADRAGTFALLSASARSGTLQPSLGLSSIPVTIRDVVSVGNGIKWHPGQYVVRGTLLTAAKTGWTTSMLDSIVSAGAKGVKLSVSWGNLEPTRGNYNFAEFDAFATACKTRGLRFCLELLPHAYVTQSISSAITSGYFPAYLTDTGEFGANGGLYKNAVAVCSRIWTAAVMSRWIALWQAIGAHYDSDPMFEDAQMGEFTSGDMTGDPAYTDQALHDQLLLYIAAMPAALPHTSRTMVANSGLGQGPLFKDVIAKMAAGGMSLGDHDIRPDRIPPYSTAGGTAGQRTYQGIDGGIDYRNVMACCPNVEGVDIAGYHVPTGADATRLLTQINDFAFNSLRASRIYWLYLDYVFGSNTRPSSTNYIQWLNSVPSGNQKIHDFVALQLPVNSVPPSNYSAVNTGAVAPPTNVNSILFYIDYTGGTLGAAGPSASGYYAAYPNSVYDNTHLESGFTRCLKQSTVGGVDDPTVGTSYTLAQKLAKGDEFWHSIRVFIPPGYSFAASPHLKWFRYRTETPAGANKGYADIYFDPNGAGAPANTWKFIKEQVDVWNYFDQSNGLHAPVLGSWHTYDYYVKFDDGVGRVRFWIDKELIGDIAVATLTSATDLVINALTWTYWNGNAPQTQSLYIGREAYAVKCAASGRNDTALLTSDAAGNKLIALGL